MHPFSSTDPVWYVDRSGLGISMAQITEQVLISDERFAAFLRGEMGIGWREAAGLSAVRYALQWICGSLAYLPINLFRRSDGQVEQVLDHPVLAIMREDDGLNSLGQMRYTLQLHALLLGNGRALIGRDRRGVPETFDVLPHDAETVVVQDESGLQGGSYKYHVFVQDGVRRAVPDEDVLHIYQFSMDGIAGIPMLDLSGRLLRVLRASEMYAERFFTSGAIPSMVLVAPPGALRNRQDAEELLTRFNQYHRGLENAHRVGLLRDGVEPRLLGFNHRDAQMLEQRSFGLEEVMRLFALPSMPGVGSQGTESERQRLFVQQTLMPWMRVWEAELNRKLLTREERQFLFWKMDDWELSRPGLSDRTNVYATMVRNLLATPNEMRRREGLPPLEGGDQLINPATTAFDSRDGGDSNRAAQQDAAAAGSRSSARGPAVAQAALRSRLRVLLHAEIRRVEEQYPRCRDWPAWLESYYAEHAQRLSEVAAELGCDPGTAERLAEDWCTSHRETLRACASPGAVSHACLALAGRLDAIAEKWLSTLMEGAADGHQS